MWFQRVPSGAEIAEPARKHIHSRLNAAFAAAVLCMAAGAAHAAEPAFETVVVAERRRGRAGMMRPRHP